MAPGWRTEIRTRSEDGRIASRNGGLRSTASQSIPACTGAGRSLRAAACSLR